MLSRGAVVTVVVEKPAAGGLMIARVDGEVVFVRGAIPGERVRCVIDGRRRGVAHATVTDVLEPDSDRRGSGAAPACGGNAYAYIALERQRALKSEIVADAFTRLARLPLEHEVAVAASPAGGYRMRARLHVQNGSIGFFREGTHELCDPATTGQLLPATIETLAHFARSIRTLGLNGISEIELTENIEADQRALHLGMVSARSVDLEAAKRLAEIPGVTGLTCAAPQSTEIHLLGGDRYVRDPMGALVDVGDAQIAAAGQLRRRAPSFFQGNRFLLRALVARVVSKVGSGAVADLYAGVGLFACALAAAGHDAIVAVEGDRTTGEDLAENATQFGAALRVERRPVEPFLGASAAGEFATIVVDPPRTGLSREALTRLIALRPGRVVYVSCDVATLARDARRLSAERYGLESLEAFDLFPNTAHIETLAVFSEKST